MLPAALLCLLEFQYKLYKVSSSDMAKIKIPKILKNHNTQLLMAIVLFALAAFLTSKNHVYGWEEWLFTTIYGWSDALLLPFVIITQAGNVFVFFALAAALLLKKYHAIVIRLLMSGLLSYLLAGVAKDLVGRGRPLELLSDIVYRDYIVRGAGFPSGHTALATAVALVIGAHLPKRYQWLVPAIIIGVALSRIYLGVHLPLDVVGGFAIGWGSVALFRNVQLRTIKKRKRNIEKRRS